MKKGWLYLLLFPIISVAQNYPQNYFRHPLNIPMQLVANYGEIRANHWHMGLDIRTQQKVNLPVYASAEGYISRVLVEPGGFGQAIYISHPNGFTTLYAHLNSFFPQLAAYVKQKQYEKESWHIDLEIPPGMFPVKKGTFIARSGSTGGSQGPHVHYEIRDTKTENVLNPLLFNFPIADKVAPTITRLAMYDRNKSTYMQYPQMLQLRRSGNNYSLMSDLVKVGSSRISFAIAAVDRFSGSNNPNGIYAARILLDDKQLSAFYHDNIGYDKTRYINAQVDLLHKSRGGAEVQHISPLPADHSGIYVKENDGVITLNDNEVHKVLIEVLDPKGNKSTLGFNVQYDPSIARTYNEPATQLFIPNKVNNFRTPDFELRTSEITVYDTVAIQYIRKDVITPGAISPVHQFLGSAIPAHDEVNVRIKIPSVSAEHRDRVIIKSVSGTRTLIQKATIENDWATAKFRQFGTYQAFIDNDPPTINNIPTSLTRATRIVFTPRDNFNAIVYFRAELDGKWLRFTNDKGRTWIYNFDEKFPRGQHELKLTVKDAAGNTTIKTWQVTR